jgi:UDP-2,3-diacylglucosamine pyrophosphatase LpxH
MVATALVVSDLHLADGSERENWGAAQQQAFEEMLAAAGPEGPLGSEAVELIVAGDGFDFSFAAPSLGERTHTDLNLAHAKWAAIVAAHQPWFAAVRAFLRAPGQRITFLVGNHDVELLYPSIRARVRSAINAPPGMVRFCLAQRYQPFPDVVIDHGCQFDPYSAIPAVWEDQPVPTTPAKLETTDGRGVVGPLQLPWISRYDALVFPTFKRHLPYLDEMTPSLSVARSSALVCQLAPHAVLEALPHLATLVPDPVVAASLLTTATTAADPITLFTALLVAAQAIGASVAGTPPDASTTAEVTHLVAAMQEDRYALLRASLSIDAEPISATTASVRAAASVFLATHPDVRFFLTGHTHEEGRWATSANQWHLNTGTWYPRLARPHVEAFTPEYSAWATAPTSLPYPGQDGSRFIAAWLRAEPGAATVAELIAWRDGGFFPVPDDAMARW